MMSTYVRRIQMFPQRLSRFSGRNTLVVMMMAFVFGAAACSGSADVEAEDAAADAEAVENDETQVADDVDASSDAGDDAGDDVTIDSETDAMGEDDAMADDDVATTVTTTGADSAGTTASALESQELTAAFAAGTGDRFSLPFMYLTVDQDCEGCAETMSLYYVPGQEKASILTLAGAYIDGVAQSDFSAVDPVLQAGDPRRVAEQLSGTDATYGIDTVSGAITSWSLDGNSVTVRCLQVDTRPIDMRTELCENSIIG